MNSNQSSRPWRLCSQVASGRADALSGCYLSVDDDLEALVAEAEAIQREARLTLRLRV
jgi:hypothetical protein